MSVKIYKSALGKFIGVGVGLMTSALLCAAEPEGKAPAAMAPAPAVSTVPSPVVTNKQPLASAKEDMPPITQLLPFNEFAGIPPFPLNLRTLAEGEAPEEYIVEAGDTLFDICSQLLDEGGYWPKLWSMNEYIKNPHYIWPGMRLGFYPGDGETPPFLEVAMEKEIVPIDKTKIDVDDLLKTMLPDLKRYQPVAVEVIGMDDLPSSPNKLDEFGTRFKPSEQMFFTVPGFIFTEEIDPMGIVAGGTLGEASIGESGEVLAVMHGSLEIGETYTALRFSQRIRNRETNEFVGYLYQFVSQVRMERYFDDQTYAVFKVTKSRLGLENGDFIVPYHSTKRNLDLTKQIKEPPATYAHIVAFEDEYLELGGDGSIVFLDRGKIDGYAPGQVLKLHQQLNYLVQNKVLKSAPEEALHVGFLRILDVTEVGSIGLIISSPHEINIGDTAGKG